VNWTVEKFVEEEKKLNKASAPKTKPPKGKTPEKKKSTAKGKKKK
jgi:hypothetical protein